MPLLKVVRFLADLPPVLTGKHKTLMILVSNAKYALDGVPPGGRMLFVKMEHDDPKRVRMECPYVPAQEAV